MISEALKKALAILEEVTPLKFDCGKLCDKACCADDGQDENSPLGMLLFPTEEEGYADQWAWSDIYESALDFEGKPVPLLVCNVPCPRPLRPFACRIFPLFPYLQEDGSIKTDIDIRALPLCPLCPSGAKGLDPRFVAAVQAAGEALAADPTQRAFLALLTDHVNSHKPFEL